MKMFLAFIAICVLSTVAFSATLTVTNTNDSGAGSLRDAIANAASGDTITFDLAVPATIALTSGELFIDKSLTIEGPGANDLSIRGMSGFGFRVMEIDHANLNVTLSGLTLTGGSDLSAGGLFNTSTGLVTLTNCAVTNNTGVDGGDGIGAGGIYNSGTMVITGSTVSGNVTSGFDGGPPLILGAGIDNLGTLTLTNSTIARNRNDDKGFGGGIGSVKGIVTITSCTIAANFAIDGGGGIANYAPDGAPEGVHIMNSIVAGNSGGDSPDIYAGVDLEGYNLIGDGSGARLIPKTGDQVGTADSPIIPKLGALSYNRGPTQTLALLPGSPAIDKGNSFGLTSDQRGLRRPIDDPTIPPAEGGDNSDIGAFEVQAARPLNISTRADVLTDDQILDGGFIITGSEPKSVLIRGLGPSLAEQHVTGYLADPVLQLNDSTGVLMTNDNWKDSQEMAIKDTGIPPTNDLESAILVTLPPGAYTAILSGKDSGTGVGLVEVYDLESASDSTLGNLSTRGFVGLEDNVMIAGFIAGAGDGGPDNVLIRALGPSLAQRGVSDPLADPTLELHDADGTVIASNDNWKDTQEAAIEATHLAPPDDAESALLEALPAGAYTAVVRGANATTGVALVEVYDLTNGTPSVGTKAKSVAARQ